MKTIIQKANQQDQRLIDATIPLFFLTSAQHRATNGSCHIFTDFNGGTHC